MKRHQPTLANQPGPLQIFLALLAVLFCLEIAVMFVLPEVMPSRVRWLEAIVDAALLIFVLAPLLWIWVVRPLRLLATTRTLLLEQTIRAQEDERRRLARDLHDEIGQSLTSLLVGLKTLQDVAAPGEAREQAGVLRQQVGSIHDEVRRLARGLRPGVLDDLGLSPALERLAEDFGQTHAIQVELSANEALRLSAEMETALYRIVQEALNNIAKHAQAGHVKIEVVCNAATVELHVHDDGCGFDAAEVFQRGSSFGLSSMRERAALLAGKMHVHSQRGGGTHIHICIPVQEN